MLPSAQVVQLYEMFNVRFGVMLVGPTGGGKTQCYRMLQSASGRLREQNHPDPGFQKVRSLPPPTPPHAPPSSPHTI